MKYNLPDLYVSESSEFDRLYRLGNTRSTTGNITFTSSSSNTSYSSITGQLGIMHQLEAILAPYKINASDWNDLEDMFISHKAEMSIHLAGGTANTITISTGGDFQYQQGKWLQFKATANSTGNVTINVDDKGAKPFLKLDGSQIASGGVKSLKVYKAYYDTGSGGRFFLLASAEGNAVAVDVLAGKTFSNDDDVGIVGTMPNLGTVNNTITTQNGQYTIPEGYHNGDGKVIANFANLNASNIKSGINIGGIIGTLVEGKRVATGTFPSSATSYRVNNLNFTPTLVFMYATGCHSNYRTHMGMTMSNSHTATTRYGGSNCFAGRTLKLYEDANSRWVSGDSATSLITNGFEFTLSTNMNYISYYWIAVEL